MIIDYDIIFTYMWSCIDYYLYKRYSVELAYIFNTRTHVPRKVTLHKTFVHIYTRITYYISIHTHTGTLILLPN